MDIHGNNHDHELEYNANCMEFMNLHYLQSLQNCYDKIQNKSVLNINVETIKCEYMSLNVLFQKQGYHWNVPFVVLCSAYMANTVVGFICFFDIGRDEESDAWLLAASIGCMTWSIAAATVNFTYLANLSKVPDELKEMFIMIDFYKHQHSISAVQLINFIDIHRCAFKMGR